MYLDVWWLFCKRKELRKLNPLKKQADSGSTEEEDRTPFTQRQHSMLMFVPHSGLDQAHM